MREQSSLLSVRLSVAVSLLFGLTGCVGNVSSARRQPPKGPNEVAYDAMLRVEGAQSYRDARYMLS